MEDNSCNLTKPWKATGFWKKKEKTPFDPSSIYPHRGDYIHVRMYVQSVTAATIWSKVWGQRLRCLLPSYRHVKAQCIIFDANAPCCSSTLTSWKLKHFFCSSGYFTEAVGCASQQCSAFLQGREKLKGLLAPHLPAAPSNHSQQDVPGLYPTCNLGHIKPASGSLKGARLHLTAVARSLTCSSFLCLGVSISLFQKGDAPPREKDAKINKSLLLPFSDTFICFL